MNLEKAIELNKESASSLRNHKFIDHADAVQIGIDAIKRPLTMRSYGINQALYPLPGEKPQPDLAPSAERKQKLRESPLGKKPKSSPSPQRKL